jgi:hypothetical protein
MLTKLNHYDTVTIPILFLLTLLQKNYCFWPCLNVFIQLNF